MIHTRVPESLEAELRRKAQDLGISVSNLVRNVLGHAFGLVGDMVADGHAIARAARGDAPAAGRAGRAASSPHASAPASPSPSPSSPASASSPASLATGIAPPVPGMALGAPAHAIPAIDDVLGWQPMVLGKNAVCARCNAILPRGSDAATGIADAIAVRLVICLTCLAQLRATPTDTAPRSES